MFLALDVWIHQRDSTPLQQTQRSLGKNPRWGQGIPLHPESMDTDTSGLFLTIVHQSVRARVYWLNQWTPGSVKDPISKHISVLSPTTDEHYVTPTYTHSYIYSHTLTLSHTLIFTHSHTYIHTHTHTYTHTLCVWIYVCECVNMSVCDSVSVCEYMYECVYVCVT